VNPGRDEQVDFRQRGDEEQEATMAIQGTRKRTTKQLAPEAGSAPLTGAAPDPIALVMRLVESGQLDRLQQEIVERYPLLDVADAQWVVGAAVDAVQADLAAGKEKRDVPSYLRAVAKNKACDLSEKRFETTEYVESGQKNRGEEWKLSDDEREDIAQRAEDRRRHMLSIAIQLATRITQAVPRRVMLFLLKAWADDWHDVTNADVAEALNITRGNVAIAKMRARDQMVTLAKTAKLLDFDLIMDDIGMSDNEDARDAADQEEE
jgi:DNA-directed RNA polymerase specialized sigma24 family protein